MAERVKKATESRLLDLSGLGLTRLPDDIFDGLHELWGLWLTNNKLSELPPSIGNLTNLCELWASDNRLTELPSELGRLAHLRLLNVEGNSLRELPTSLEQLSELRTLRLDRNPLNLPRELLNLDAQRLLSIYTESHGDRGAPLNEAKLILVGRGGAGKTSLVNRLVFNTFDPNQSKTPGIAVTSWPVSMNEETITVHIWDFGGQELMHSTHQFFMTERSLYVLVLNAREGDQDSNIDYWMRLIRSFGGESPVIVVINQIAEHALAINRRGLQDKYPRICGFVSTDCKGHNGHGVGIDELRLMITNELAAIPSVRARFPRAWFKVKDSLSTMSANYLTYTEYSLICRERGVVIENDQRTLVRYLHDLGIILNFTDDQRLQDTHVLSPHWVTAGVYAIVTSDDLRTRGDGIVRVQDVRQLLDDNAYPTTALGYLLALMTKFGLCYQMFDSPDLYLIPELLGPEEPDLSEFDQTGTLRFEYRYDVLPEGLLARFIVAAQVTNENQPRWRTGAVVVFEQERAVVRAEAFERRVTIAVRGRRHGRRGLLSIIRFDLEKLHAQIPNLAATSWVPLPGFDGEAISHVELAALEDAGKPVVQKFVRGGLREFKVRDLLEGVDARPVRTRVGRLRKHLPRPVRLFVSYAHEDRSFKQQLDVRLKVLSRQGLVEAWTDSATIPGDELDDAIEKAMEGAQLILLLVSPAFLASDYCRSVEVPMAMSLLNRGRARVMPVVLRPDDRWQSEPYGRLKATPTDAKPVSTWSSRDDAWNVVANDIERAAAASWQDRHRLD